MAKVGTSNQDRTISLKAAVRSCINKQTNKQIVEAVQCCIGIRECDVTAVTYLIVISGGFV